MWSKVVESGKDWVRLRGQWSKVEQKENEPEQAPKSGDRAQNPERIDRFCLLFAGSSD
jgi:hypothetical protein